MRRGLPRTLVGKINPEQSLVLQVVIPRVEGVKTQWEADFIVLFFFFFFCKQQEKQPKVWPLKEKALSRCAFTTTCSPATSNKTWTGIKKKKAFACVCPWMDASVTE